MTEEPQVVEASPENPIKTYMEFARTQPVKYAKKILGIKLWRKQRAIMRAIADPETPFVCVKSGNGVGKTFLSATIIINYLDSHAPGYCVVSGASWNSLLKTAWATVKKVYRQSPVDLGGEMLNSEWRRDDMWGAFCVSPDDPESFAGFRTENGAMVLIDEASSLTQETFDAIMGICSAKGSKIVLLGNPLRPSGPFYECFKNDDWAKFTISSEEAAATGIKGLADTKWIERAKERWGEDTPQYYARVLGRFPSASEFALIPSHWEDSYLVEKPFSTKGVLSMGVDVARYGHDETVIAVRDERNVLGEYCYRGKSVPEVAQLTKQHAKQWNVSPEEIRIDDTGVGGGVTDILWSWGMDVIDVEAQSGADDKETFLNRRAEMYWALRDALNPSEGSPFFIPRKYKDLLEELGWQEYEFSHTGKIQISKKEKIRKDHGKSPDRSDALALSFAKTSSEFGIGFM